jgi:type IV secretory pathway VirB3-like protein
MFNFTYLLIIEQVETMLHTELEAPLDSKSFKEMIRFLRTVGSVRNVYFWMANIITTTQNREKDGGETKKGKNKTQKGGKTKENKRNIT